MERELDECRVDEPVEASVVPGSSHRIALRIGARIALELEESTGRVLVTRAGGRVKIGYVTRRHEAIIAACLHRGCRYSGQIAEVAIGPVGKMLRLRLDPPGR